MAVLTGKKAPLFEADAVVNGSEFVEKFSLEQYLGKKYVVFFFYPLDFTFVCPTEILAFQERLQEFEAKNCAVVGCSVDSKFSHWAWLNTELKDGGIKGVKFPLVSDLSKSIAQNFDVLAGEYVYDSEDDEIDFDGEAVAYRGLFLIDKQGVVRHQLVNDLPLGRSVDEALRMVEALQCFEENGEVCPANWKPGEETIKETHESVSEYLGKK
ncbi:MAG: alkyl hydroperoxide reductase [Marinilabiliales bacterium]|nr:MAG: alkyl hydroperoxide reductase [Marinilabiliales bacterium]